MNELRRGPWKLTDLASVKKNGRKVFSIFSCGGGSTMGYKLAGYDVIGCCEIDPQMLELYQANHHPRLPFLMGVQEFKTLPDLPPELYDLDILDGSPPCSSFSMSGSRDKAWGEKKKFREGQAEQVLDDLFFHFIEVAARLKPKVVVAENVKGLVNGKARGYVKQIFKGLEAAGYETQLFLLNAASMGVPQRRERTFFIAQRMGAGPLKNMTFEEPPIPFSAVKRGTSGKSLGQAHIRLWKERKKSDLDLGSIALRIDGKAANWNHKLLHGHQVSLTLASAIRPIVFDEPRHINDEEVKLIQSFPEDFDFRKTDPGYVCGMSVPPFMMQRVADKIYRQWFADEKKGGG